MKRIGSVVGLVVFLATFIVGQNAKPSSPSLMKATFSKLPIYFIENRGVYPDEVEYYIQGAEKTLFFTKGGITFRLRDKDRAWILKLEFVGADLGVAPHGGVQQQAIFSYFRGPEKDWKTGLRSYSRLVYRDLWPGIDLVYEGMVNRLKYEFVVGPGADPGKIRLRYRGASETVVKESGGLKVQTPVGSFEDAPPMAWQNVEGNRVPVKMAYLPAENDKEENEFGFAIGEYDLSRPLVLDPAVLVYCGYVGGVGDDFAYGIAVDASGDVYLAGETSSSQASFPLKVGPHLIYNGQTDGFIVKVNASGTGLIYCGYIGGSNPDYGEGIAVDPSGNVYVSGITGSTEIDFPVKTGPDLTFNGAQIDMFVAKVNPDGKSLAYCGYIGSSNDEGYFQFCDATVDASGSMFLAGMTMGSNVQGFPVKLGPGLNYAGQIDAFVAKVHPIGKNLIYCGYIGGSSSDVAGGIAVDSTGNAYVCGFTISTEWQNFPVKTGPDLTSNGSYDAFVAKISLTLLEGSGTIRPGGKVNLALSASDSAGHPYQLGSSFGTGPIPIDTRQLDLNPDDLLRVSAGNLWPWVFSGYKGVIDGNGQAMAAVNIPNLPALKGLRIYTAFVTLDPSAPSGVSGISNTFMFTIINE